ncbi:MAG: Uma2 family endonuclease [Oscillatoria sp. PMC 1051.18]|nr:Uma2 family endonuclease [Oscillatoria sp. PMC 1050.18]MEC5029477.1 Uma2 family endonuclease [Oscillatoria sp. PMC 1051.18]
MSQSVTAKETLTFEEYRFYQPESDLKYELFRGHLLPMPIPTALHSSICQYLVYKFQHYFATTNLDLVAKTDIGVRTEVDTSRIPDVIVCSSSLWSKILNRPGSGIFDFEEIPNLVVEVTSENWREDYIRKRAEYALVNIPEYWIVDPKKEQIWVLSHPEGEEGYDRQSYTRGQNFPSEQFPDLILSVDTLLAPPIVENLLREEQMQRQQLQQQVDEERQKSRRLEEKLREMGIDPDTI